MLDDAHLVPVDGPDTRHARLHSSRSPHHTHSARAVAPIAPRHSSHMRHTPLGECHNAF